MAEFKLLAPYGGITRIRFKGSPIGNRRTELSAIGSPALSFQNRTRAGEVNARNAARPDPPAASEIMVAAILSSARQ